MSAYKSSFDGGGSFSVGGNFSGGNRIFVADKENLTIGVGESVSIPIVLSVDEYSKYYIFYIINQDTLVTVDWFNSVNVGFMREKVVALASSAPDGTFLEGRVQAGHVKIEFINNGVGDITEIYVCVFGIR